MSRFEDDFFRMRESSIIRDKERSRKSMNRQKQLFERFSQRKRFNFEMMKKTLNLDSIEALQMSFRRRSRSSEKERREEYRDTRDDARDDARNDARDNARDNARDDARNDVKDKTNVFMKNVF